MSSAETVVSMLQDGSLWILMGSGRYWRLRQNGKVKRWKRDMFRYRIPVKAGLRVYSEITNDTQIGTFDSKRDIICSSTDPNTCENRRIIIKHGALVA
jgi:hypothetical protein